MKRLALLLFVTFACAQEREDRTLLNWDQMRAIINEASGERGMHHVLELVPYPRVRSRAEYETHFRESEVMARFAKEYGFSSVEIESYPDFQRIWHAHEAQLWEVKPQLRKIYDVHDVAVSIASGSESGDVTAELVDVGAGARPEDYAGKDVKGKIVLGSARAGTLRSLGVSGRGAVGVLSYNVMYPEGYSDIGLSQSVGFASTSAGKPPVFGWAVSPRVGRELAARLASGEKITLRSIVKAEVFPAKSEVVQAAIPGDGSSDQEIAVTAHLYEGYLKQGANDDASGCAATLEMGRAYLRLVQEGKLPRPKRTIRFLWVPEISGTRAWLNRHQDLKKKLIADLNFDMAGLSLARAGSFWELDRTPDTFPSFLSDVSASALEFVGNTNRERVRYRHNGYGFSLPVLAPNGTRDPLYFAVDKYYGASDHAVFLDQGIPASMFSTWPDPWYHSSQDTPDKLDSTMFKRAAVVGAAAMTVLATADDQMATRVAGEVFARGAERMGQAERKGLGYMADLSDPATLRDAWRDAHVSIRHQAEVEKEAVRSARALFSNPAEAANKLAPLLAAIEQRALALQAEARAFYQLQAEQRKATAGDLAPNDAEKQLARIIPERGGASAQMSAEERAALQAKTAGFIPRHMTSEWNILLNRTPKLTALQIRDFLTGEFEPIPAADFLDYLKASEKLGTMKLTVKPEEPPPAPPPAPPVKKGAKTGKKG